MTPGATTAVVPLRGGSGKTRLAADFGAPRRRDLVASLARHVVGTVLAAGAVRDVIVVTTDPAFTAEALTADRRLAVLVQPVGEPGLNRAVRLGQQRAVAAGADRLLVIHADLPLLTTADINALLAARAPLVLAPDSAGSGTNALVLNAAEARFQFRFGPASRSAHAAQADALGLRPVVIDRPGTSIDLDTSADWRALPGPVRHALSRTVGRGERRPPSAPVPGWPPNLPAAPPAPGALQ